jgi:magnesium chelatase family protein
MRIHSSYTERLSPGLLAGRPPYRAPHHQASAAAVLGTADVPGELSLAHGGVLFLDELPEFRRDLLEALREPLETGEIRVSRSKRKSVWKARVILVAACNNCACGWYGSPRKRCRCPLPSVLAYRQRLSGPVLDRIDMHVNVPEPMTRSASLFLHLAAGQRAGQTARMREKVRAAQERATRRNAAFGTRFNSQLPAQYQVAASGLASGAFEALVNQRLPRAASTRSLIRCLRVARTLGDLADSPSIREEDLATAWAWQAEPAAAARGEQLEAGG